jgi:hypothetical protein
MEGIVLYDMRADDGHSPIRVSVAYSADGLGAALSAKRRAPKKIWLGTVLSRRA